MTTPGYNPSIPKSDNNIAESQVNFLNNFSSLYDAFSQNHTPLDDANNPGNHEVVELIEQPLSISTQSQEIAIYSKKVDGQTDQLFMRYGANGKEFQITNYQIYPIQETSTQRAFFSFLPGGIIAYFGRVFSNGTRNFKISLNPPVRTSILGINLGGIATISPQPNVSLTAPINGVYTEVNLTSQLAMPDQFYLIFATL